MNYRNKNIILVAGFALALLLCYKFAITRTSDLKDEYQSLIRQELLLKNAPEQLRLLNRKKIYYDSILNRYEFSGSSIQSSLLKLLNEEDSNNLKVKNFLEPHSYYKNDLLVKGVVSLAKVLGLTIIAEGVETEDQARMCRNLEVDKIQGHFYSKPRPLSKVEELLFAETVD